MLAGSFAGMKTTCLWLVLAVWLAHAAPAGAQVFRVATFNVENYVEDPASRRPLKPAAARAKVCESIVALKPDVIALQEMGSTNALMELQGALKKSGLDLPFWDHITGSDTNIHLALLSRFPIASRHPHTNETYLLGARRFYVSRGFLEDEIKVNTNYKFTLIAGHLKSKMPSGIADEQEWREEEAVVLRRIIDARLASDPEERLVVLGDLNDTQDSRTMKSILGRGKTALFDTRPAERGGGRAGPQTTGDPAQPRRTTWTDFYAKEDSYSRLDYILISHGLQRDWRGEETYILNLPDWGVASDHRPLVAGFMATGK
jgi:endonuclease/exonuclease/phosphatase family metal-dependent hydrolase